MNQQITLFGDTASIADLAGKAIRAVVNGDIDPIEGAYTDQSHGGCDQAIQGRYAGA